ncbi:cysteine--1-D-myo-inosityl 2-amino-2-deoxy-alpha-D-glucopyranoside ligase [Brachybacterium sp. J153]|uniref:cysteine--1-D-myo-inosityl 2-amino-2-deoxy-alpha-D-glucopyranoside ligase n=1 Tax=Brachybacterium sp. J153 TaxID=3116488 RepID=UPI002E78FBC6|nr:cysteine--1-D-myo-inosityl 2-amino-2-deoxy-alpha-D-glucopyranoside ligase [Brachybacterium sp. J153]MEE1617387.1 cysteine--1-D-myo-inosityl 2-amino-2-deoxy-alpha-D-glucopyranoside ligase [Brachybacterium sp. J153]
MRSWTSPSISPLPASGLPLRLHDTRTGRIAPLVPLTPGTARLYVCGITPYDATHLGHAATYHAADLMRRALRDSGLEVEVAQNITDVDDPLLERAERDGVDWRELAASQVDLFAEDMEALRIVAPETYLSVSEAMDQIIDTVDRLRERGRAYQVETPDAEGEDWYLDLSVDGALGDVSGWSEQQMLSVVAERGGDPDRRGKRGRFDPLLWRAERAGEPAWDAGELGRGRPGWHVECVCIAEGGLGLPFDVQAGGSDLVFPHHDLSAAHAVALGRNFATAYAHSGMVALDGEKMSKSLGNLVFVHRLVRDGVDPMAIRLVLMAHHYRADWEWSEAELTQAEARLASYRAAAALGGRHPDTVEALRAALRQDLDTPSALVALDAWAARAGAADPAAEQAAGETGPDAAEARPGDVATACDALLGLALTD